MRSLTDLSQTHHVIRRKDVLYLQEHDKGSYQKLLEVFDAITKYRGANYSYTIVNEDEPYAKEILELIRKKETELAKIYEFKDDYTFLIVARNLDSAKEYLIKEGYYLESDFKEKELDKDTHFLLTDEEDGSKMDVWDMLKKDIENGTRMPYMIATTCL